MTLKEPKDGKNGIHRQAVSLAMPECGKKNATCHGTAHSRKSSTTAGCMPWRFPGSAFPSAARVVNWSSTTTLTNKSPRHCATQLGLLSGAQIRKNREELGLSQREMAEHLGVAVETISRWENSALTQTRAMDRYLRVYFAVPAARAALVGQSGISSLGIHIET